MDIYQGADKAIREMNRQNLKAFNQLKLAKWDELNVIRKVNETYEQSTRRAVRKYYEIAVEAYIVALYQMKMDKKKATDMADDIIDLYWVYEMLDEVDPVTMYAFFPERDRKKERLIEALTATNNRNAEIDKALRYWTVQVGQYADNSVYRARLQAFKDAGVKQVRWVTKHDERVCGDCDELDGQIFPIDQAPPPQHIHCRCLLLPA
jgi:SPP1 gp7 family putative phage head morphogenesis protein